MMDNTMQNNLLLKHCIQIINVKINRFFNMQRVKIQIGLTYE